MALVIVGIPVAPALSQSSAFASSTGLSTTILSRTLYGLVQVPHGSANGPLTLPDFRRLPVYFPGERTLEGEIATGATGYVRTWVNKPADGDGAFILALKFKKKAQASGFDSVDQATMRSNELNKFLVPGVLGATGFELLPSQSALMRTEYVVDFSKGSIFFCVVLLDGLGDISSFDAATLAKKQAAHVPSS